MQQPFPAYKGKEPFIFVSYSHQDDTIVYQEILWLKEQGFNIWYDEGISPGSEWRDELAERIDDSSLFLYFVSPKSVGSEHCKREVNFATDQKKQLLVVHLEETTLPSGLGMSLSPIQAIMRYEISELDYRIKLLRGATDHLQRGISAPIKATNLPRSPVHLLASVALIIGLIAGITAGLVISKSGSNAYTTGSLKRLEVKLNAGEYVKPATSTGMPLGISRDGNQILFSGTSRLGLQLYARNLDDFKAVPVRGTQTQHEFISAEISPDGEWIVFSDKNTIRKVRTAGGTPITVARIPGASDLAWGPDDTIVFAQTDHGIMKVSAKGGTPEPLTVQTNGEEHVQPQLLPGGDQLIFTLVADNQADRIVLQSLSDGLPRRILLPGNTPKLTASGHLTFFRDNALWATRFDTATAGDPVPLLEAISSDGGYTSYGVADDGTLIYWPYSAESQLVWVDRKGITEVLDADRNTYVTPRISPVGSKIAVVLQNPDGEVWIYEPETDRMTRLADATGVNSTPLWSPDGQSLIYSSNRGGRNFSLYKQSINATSKAERLTTSINSQFPNYWPKNNKKLLLSECRGTACALGLLSLRDDYTVEIVTEHGRNMGLAVLSPNGRYIAYQSTESGRQQIYVRPFPNMDSNRWQVSTEGGQVPQWNKNGREIFYWGKSHMMVVPVATKRAFQHDEPEQMFAHHDYAFHATRNYDVSRDGERFLMVKPKDSDRIVVILNWFDELERLLPEG